MGCTTNTPRCARPKHARDTRGRRTHTARAVSEPRTCVSRQSPPSAPVMDSLHSLHTCMQTFVFLLEVCSIIISCLHFFSRACFFFVLCWLCPNATCFLFFSLSQSAAQSRLKRAKRSFCL